MKNIILIGMPGCGKSILGRSLAEALDRRFTDADREIEILSGSTIPDLFAVSEEHFRNWETRAVEQLLKEDGQIAAMGGGVVLREKNVEMLRARGLVIFLDRPPDDIAKDVDTSGRPLLAQGRQQIYTLYAQREKLYRAAAHVTVVNRGPVGEVLEKLLQAVACSEAGGEEHEKNTGA